MEKSSVTKATLGRLPAYLELLRGLPAEEHPYISATTIAKMLSLGEVQVRKDLAMVSDGGRPKVGYERAALAEDIARFLGYDNTNDAVLIGAGKLGCALLGYTGFAEYGLNIAAAFDVAVSAERTECGKPVYPMQMLGQFCRREKILMGIITVPAAVAQQVCDDLIACGVKAIWNFAPTHLDVPQGILVQNENMATSLAVLSKHLSAQMMGY